MIFSLKIDRRPIKELLPHGASGIHLWQFNLLSIILSRYGGNNLYIGVFSFLHPARRRCNFGSRIFLLARKVNRAPSFIWRVPHTWRPRPNVYLFCFREPIITFATGACNDLCPLSSRTFSLALAISLGFLSRPDSAMTLSTVVAAFLYLLFAVIEVCNIYKY